ERVKRVVRQLVVMASGDAVQRHPVGISIEVSGEVSVGERANARVGRLPCGRWLRLLPGRVAGSRGCHETHAEKTGCPVSNHARLYRPPSRQGPRAGRAESSRSRVLGTFAVGCSTPLQGASKTSRQGCWHALCLCG